MDIEAIRKGLMMTKAEFCDLLGVSDMTYWRWAHGVREPDKIYQSYIRSYYLKHAPKIEFTPTIIKSIRKSNNLTQVEFAKVLKVGKSTLCDWESGRQTPNLQARKRIYEFYKTHRN